jgi:DNA-binding LytR/AlgR family response regulator
MNPAPMLRVALVDDELVARKRLSRLLKECSEVELVGVCETALEIMNLMAEEELDVVFFDIAMPTMTGVEACRQLPEDGPLVVFTTAYPDYALTAFELGVLDYLVKPVSKELLERALLRARERLHPLVPIGTPFAEQPVVPMAQRLAVKTQAGFRMLDPSTISHALLEHDLVTIFVHQEPPVLCEESLTWLEEKLKGNSFERVSRQALLNIALVRELKAQPNGCMIACTHEGAEITVSRQAARRLRRRLGLGF